MIRNSLYILIASLCVYSPGCSSSKAPVQPEKELQTNGTNAAEKPQLTTGGNTSESKAAEPELSSADAIESAVLKQAMVEVSVELMKKQQPNIDPEEVLKKVEYAITQIRKDVPDFLMVSAEVEKRLQANEQIKGVEKRISDATAYLNKSGSNLSGLVASLLPQYKAGTLPPVRTELLAQIVVADVQKKQAALTK